jgi:hypothetical protein
MNFATPTEATRRSSAGITSRPRKTWSKILFKAGTIPAISDRLIKRAVEVFYDAPGGSEIGFTAEARRAQRKIKRIV